MSDHIVTLIPCLHTYRTNVQRAEAAVEALLHLVEAEEITFRQSERPEFVDCGAALSEVRCPRCGALLPGAGRTRRWTRSFALRRAFSCSFLLSHGATAG